MTIPLYGLDFGLRIGVRASPMAMAFGSSVQSRILAVCPLLKISVSGYMSQADRIPGSLADCGGKGLFINDLESRLLQGEIDLAVHALKDMPGYAAFGEILEVAAYMPRNDPRDCLVLRQGVEEEQLRCFERVIGTSSPRRCAALRKIFPLAHYKPTRGNVGTRLRKLESGEIDALILAKSGLDLLGLSDRSSRCFREQEVIPAAGQGIICIQIRQADLERFSFLPLINDPDSMYCARAECEVLKVLGGSCHSAISAFCQLDHLSGKAHLRACVFGQRNKELLFSEATAPLVEASAVALGLQVGHDLLAKGAADLL